MMNTQKMLGLTKKAFQLHKVKTDMLRYAFEQIKPILKRYMKTRNILELEVKLKRPYKTLVLEPIENGERAFWVDSWLNNEISTEQLVEKMKYCFQWVEYFSFTDFLGDVETWVKEMK